MKVYIQVVDSRTGVHQSGMIDEPVRKGDEILNALRHFSVGSVDWINETSIENLKVTLKSGIISGTTKLVSVITLE